MAEPRDAVDAITAHWRLERPDLDPSPLGVVVRISRIAALVERELESVFDRHGLSGGDFEVLATLRRAGDPFRLAPGELSRATLITTGGMTKRLDRLEAAGLVRREDDPHDRRGKLIALTDEGKSLADRAIEARLKNEERILRSLPAVKRRELAALLRELLLALDRA